jgi:hypothetical protein
MPHPNPRHLSVLTVSTALLISAPTAHAGLTGPPGPWPIALPDVTNPLAATPGALNGFHAGGHATVRVWLPRRGHRLNTVTRPFGSSTVVRGRLRNRDDHHSISAATLNLVSQDTGTGAWTPLGTTTTDRRGNFRAVIGPGTHRRIGVLYYPDANASAPIYSRRLLIRTSTSVTLDKPYHHGRRYRFDGHTTGPAPAAGLLIALQVRNNAGRWITARLATTAPNGRYRIRYRFPTSARLSIRVLVPAQNGWALYAGRSRTRRINPR